MDDNEATALLPDENHKECSRFLSFARVVWECTTKWEKLLFVLGILSALGTGLTQPLMSYTFGETSKVFVDITAAVNNKTIDPVDLEKAYEIFENGIGRVVFHFALCGTAFFIFGFIQFALLKYVGDNTTYRLQTKYISRLLHKDAEFFDATSTGYLSTILNDNLERFREAFNEKIAFIICFTTDFLIGTFLAFYTDWKLASYGSFFALGIAFCGLINTSSLMRSTEQQNKNYANAGAIAFQALGSFKTVISLNGQAQEVEKYTTELKSGEKHGSNRAFSLATARGLSHFFCNALNGIILYVGADLIYNKTMDQTTIVTLFHYMLFGAFSLSQAFPEIAYLANAISSIGPVAKVLNTKDNIIEIEQNELDDLGNEEVHGDISVRDVRFSYPTRPDTEVLKGISFDVSNGECIALVGASGNGKSTVVQLLLHYYNVHSGDILIDGVSINDINPKKLRKTIGVVSQEPVLFNTTIEENVRFGRPNATTAEIYEALRQANAYDFVCRFPKGIKTVVGERGAQLSGGQKQRIAIARVLVKNPKILLLDEATSALDNESERAVQVALENALKGRTTIIIAHRLSTIRNCDKIMVLQNGMIVETGNHHELIEREGIYKDLVQAQLLDSAENEEHHQGHADKKEVEITYEQLAESDVIDHEQKDDMKRLLNEMSEEGATSASLWEIVRQCKPDYCILFVAVIGSALQGLNFPILAQLIVRVYQAYAMEGEDILVYGHFWAAMFLVLGLARPLCFYCQFYFFGNVSERLSTRLRIKSFKHLLSLPCSFYDDPKHSPTKLSNRLSADASNVKAAVDARLGSVLMTSVSLIVAVVTASYLCWELTIQVLLFFPVLYLSKFFYEKTTVQAIAVEAFEHVKTVRSLNMETQVMEMISEHLRPLKASYRKRAFYQGLASGFSVSCSQLLYALSFKFGAWLILNENIVPMDMYLALITLSYTSNMAGSAISYLPDYKKAVHAAGLIFKLFTYPATMPYDSKDGKKNINKGEIVGENIYFHYAQRPDHLVLDGVNLQVEAGKTVALVGPSGCGKSTIISLLERFYHVHDGEMRVDNENVEDINLNHLRSNIALVSQEPTLFNCSIRDNLLYGLTRCVPQLDIEKALQTANAFHFVYQFPQGLDTIVGERGAQLSGGQKQRIAIARAILRNPKVLLLDEATSALDSDSEKIVQNALDSASERLSTIIVAHRLSTVVNADTIAVLIDGKIAEQGTHEELLCQRGIYWKLVQKSGPPVSSD